MKVGTRHLFSYLCNTILLKCLNITPILLSSSTWPISSAHHLNAGGPFYISTYALSSDRVSFPFPSMYFWYTSFQPRIILCRMQKQLQKVEIHIFWEVYKNFKTYILWTWQITSIEIGSFCQICQSCFFIEIFRLFLSQIIF